MDLRHHLTRLLSTQTPHNVWAPIVADWNNPFDALGLMVIVDGRARRMGWERVAEIVEQRELRIKKEEGDPLRWGYEPPIWRAIDLQMCRKRLLNPGVVLELLVMGGWRGGKTEGTTRRAVANFCYTPGAWIWGLHETEITSRKIQQSRVYKFLPPELRSDTGKHRKDLSTRFSYSKGGGFTANNFTIDWQVDGKTCGGDFEFRFYGSEDSTLQGSELTCAVSDELIPLDTCTSVRGRLLTRAVDTGKPEHVTKMHQALQILERDEDLPAALLGALYHGVHLVGFTPWEGFTPTVADFLDSAVTTVEVEAELLKPKTVHGRPQPQCVPRFKQPKDRKRLIAYIHSYDNHSKPVWPAIVAECEGASEELIRIKAYGDVGKNWATNFSGWRDTVHVISRADLPREGTWYEHTDYGEAKPFFTLWILVDARGRSFVAREWPQEGDDIPEVGDPGPWAVSSRANKRNGDRGDAQKNKLLNAFALDQYAAERRRVRAELGAWWHAKKVAGREPGPIDVELSYGDGRKGCSPTKTAAGSTSIIQDLAKCGIVDIPWPGNTLSDGDKLIINALAYDGRRPVDALNSPKLQVLDECKATVFMFQNYATPEFSSSTRATDEACKEARDCLASHFLSECGYCSPSDDDDEDGGSY